MNVKLIDKNLKCQISMVTAGSCYFPGCSVPFVFLLRAACLAGVISLPKSVVLSMTEQTTSATVIFYKSTIVTCSRGIINDATNFKEIKIRLKMEIHEMTVKLSSK